MYRDFNLKCSKKVVFRILLILKKISRFCRFSSVGKSAPGVSVKVDETSRLSTDSSIVELDYNSVRGEVLGYGRNIFMGYLNRENETREVMTSENWLRLGDCGLIDDKGFLIITGYAPDLIELESGEKVNPPPIEDRVRMELPCVSHCLLVGHGRDRLGLLLTLDTVVEPLTGVPSSQLTSQCKAWFKAARFQVDTLEEVILNLHTKGIKHVLQVLAVNILRLEKACKIIFCILPLI